MKRAILFVAAVVLVLPTLGKAESEMVTWTAFGIGTDSCANWQSSTAHKSEGEAWILGFWSALNLAGRVDVKIDAGIDAPDIWKEVTKTCAGSPDGKLADAVLSAYDKMVVNRRASIGN